MSDYIASLKHCVYKDAYEHMKVDECLPTLLAWVERFRSHDAFKDHVWTRDAFAKMQAIQKEAGPGNKAALQVDGVLK